MIGQQLDLLNQPRFPRVRCGDPRSSDEAAALVERTGIAGKQTSVALAAVQRYPMSTSMELARVCSLDRYALGRRLPELAALNLIRKIEPSEWTVPCAVSGKCVCRWECV